MFERTSLLIGEDNLNKIRNLNILVLGVGGVGGYAIETLIRSGLEKITLVDYDKIDITNLNRQIITNCGNIGNYKVDEFKKRILSINSNVEVNIINKKIDRDNIDLLFEHNYDYIIDACDTVIVKKLLIKECHNRGINLITVCGMGKKLDPSKVRVCDIRNTSYDPIAKMLRKYVKDERIKGKVICISSDEKPINNDKNITSSMMMVPAVAGIVAASYIINKTISQ